MKIETNKIIVVEVSERGCACAVNGQNKLITWDGLDDAVRQEDGDLANIYRAIRDEARKMVRDDRTLPITYSVHQDGTNVWWVATFHDVAGEWSWIPRAADEGGTLAHEWMAVQEAKDRAARLRKMGYQVR